MPSECHDYLYQTFRVPMLDTYMKGKIYSSSTGDGESWHSEKPMSLQELTDIRLATMIRFAGSEERQALIDLEGDWQAFKQRISEAPEDIGGATSLFSRIVQKAEIAKTSYGKTKRFSDMTPQECFDYERNASLEYLCELDRGVWGWEKVDEKIRDIVFYIQRNPHLCNWGESCEGHFGAPTKYRDRPNLNGGYFTIASDDTPESRAVFDELQSALSEVKYVKVERGVTPVSSLARYKIRLDLDAVRAQGDLDEGQLKEILDQYHGAMSRVEAILKKHSEGYPDPWDRADVRMKRVEPR